MHKVVPHGGRLSAVAGVLMMVVWSGVLGGCDLLTEPQRLDEDPQLRQLLDAGSGDEPDADEPDVGGEDTDVLPPQDFGFACSPQCLDDQFCGPGGICYTRRASCRTAGEACDPATTPRSENFVCESLFEGQIGVCRQLCNPGDDQPCRSGRSCQSLHGEPDLSVCLDECGTDERGQCDGLDVCVGGTFGVCRGMCQPFSQGQCPEGTQCRIYDAQAASCQLEGTVQENDACEEDTDCDEGLRCIGSAGGERCQQACAPMAQDDEVGACELGFGCDAFDNFDLGICRQRCNLFDEEQSCRIAGQGCVVSQDPNGLCIFTGPIAEGNACDRNSECAGDLHCVSFNGSESSCRALCDTEAGAGQPGSCPGEQPCRRLGIGILGVCGDF